jgi:hypothetical protein
MARWHSPWNRLPLPELCYIFLEIIVLNLNFFKSYSLSLFPIVEI